MKKSSVIIAFAVAAGLMLELASCAKYPTVSQRRTETFQFTHYQKH